MLCFLFTGLVVALDQFFKRWIIRTLEVGEIGPEIIPGVLGLTLWENDGAMLNILSGQQWLLSVIAFIATIILVMILLRYNEGFWGTLGLAAVLGGTIGNLIDRVFNDGKVIDMFRTLFISFPIFNFADVFITLGFITFLIHFISLSVRQEKKELPESDYEYDDYQEDYIADQNDTDYDEFPDIDANISIHAEQTQIERGFSSQDEQIYSTSSDLYPQDEISMPEDYESLIDTTTDTSFTLESLEAELGSLDDYSVDDILREYGFDDDD